MNDWNYTPYDKEIDKVMTYLKEFDLFSIYQDNINRLFDYIYKLEETIYGYTE